jgi:hypothetical protein
MKLTSPNKGYLWINGIFIGIIIAIVVYSAVFNAESNCYPVKSGSDLLGSGITAGKGLSRSFSEIVRLHFDKAKQYNVYGLRLFAFFALQLLMRFTALGLVLSCNLKRPQNLIFTDMVLSVLLFTIFFWPFLTLTMKQFVNISQYF